MQPRLDSVQVNVHLPISAAHSALQAVSSPLHYWLRQNCWQLTAPSRMATKIRRMVELAMRYEFIQSKLFMSNQYQLTIDRRTFEEKDRDKIQVEALTKRNLEALGIKLTQKALKKYVPGTLVRLQFEAGWYCYMTDNAVKSSKTILTLHGAPGNHIEWAGLEHEMGGYCRWINFVIPGFDGEDERRGTYDGTRPQLFKLILLVLDRLKIEKAIICAHSFSSTYAPLLIKTYPHRFQGYINVAGMGDYWNHGFLAVYRNVTVSQDYYLLAQKGQQPWNDDKKRPQIYGLFKERIKSLNFGIIDLSGLNLFQYFAFLKLTLMKPSQMDFIFTQQREISFLKVLFYGNNDPYFASQISEITISNLVKQKISKKEKVLTLAGKAIEERLRQQFGVQIQGKKLQQYLCFMFDKTGHAVHRRRPSQTSKVIKIYLAALETIDQYTQLHHTSL